jgi:hypothetical protein|nr:MAG TPA_asm: DNA-directed RNA polymerase [Caudoviricetes sp.]
MDEKEAIERLTDHFRIHYDGRPTPYLDKAVAIAMNALHKQIPKKPIEMFTGDEWIYKCPTCKEISDSPGECVIEAIQYCSWCGQKLDWGEEDDR